MTEPTRDEINLRFADALRASNCRLREENERLRTLLLDALPYVEDAFLNASQGEQSAPALLLEVIGDALASYLVKEKL